MWEVDVVPMRYEQWHEPAVHSEGCRYCVAAQLLVFGVYADVNPCAHAVSPILFL